MSIIKVILTPTRMVLVIFIFIFCYICVFLHNFAHIFKESFLEVYELINFREFIN